jgi:hypothetical protein
MLSFSEPGALYVHLTKEFCMRSTSVKASKVIAVCALLAAATVGVNAHASDVRWNVSIGLPFPVVVQPQPVYYPPQVVYQQPQVVYQQPQVVYPAPQVVYQQPQVVYQQPRVVYAPRPVVYAPAPVYYRHPGHGHHGNHGQRGEHGRGYGQVGYYR